MMTSRSINIGLTVCGIIMLAVFEISFAQSGGNAGAFSRVGFGARGMAMGNALTSVSTQGIYSYYNPALAAHANAGNQVDLGTSAMSFGRNLHTVTGTFRLPPSAGISVSLINANVNDIDGRNSSGYHTRMLSTHEYQLATALGLQLSEKLSAGVGLKYYIADFHPNLSNAKTVGLDLGILYKFSKLFQIGLAAKDLLAAYNWDSSTLYGDESSGRTDDFPRQVRIGSSYRVTDNILLSLEAGRTTHESGNSNNIRLGTAYDLHERITLRAGWQIDDLSSIENTNHGSAGFSIHLPFDLLSPSIDYAFVQEGNTISYMHTFGLRLNL